MTRLWGTDKAKNTLCTWVSLVLSTASSLSRTRLKQYCCVAKPGNSRCQSNKPLVRKPFWNYTKATIDKNNYEDAIHTSSFCVSFYSSFIEKICDVPWTSSLSTRQQSNIKQEVRSLVRRVSSKLPPTTLKIVKPKYSLYFYCFIINVGKIHLFVMF